MQRYGGREGRSVRLSVRLSWGGGRSVRPAVGKGYRLPVCLSTDRGGRLRPEGARASGVCLSVCLSVRPSVRSSVRPGSGVGVGGRVSFNGQREGLCLSGCLFVRELRPGGGEGVTVLRLRMSVCLSVCPERGRSVRLRGGGSAGPSVCPGMWERESVCVSVFLGGWGGRAAICPWGEPSVCPGCEPSLPPPPPEPRHELQGQAGIAHPP